MSREKIYEEQFYDPSHEAGYAALEISWELTLVVDIWVK